MKEFFNSKEKAIWINRFLVFPVIILMFTLMKPGPEDQRKDQKIRIMTTLFPLKEFAMAVSAKRGDVQLMLPPGAEIHTWRPKPSDILMLSSADLFIYIGSDLEPWVHDILKSIKNPGLHILEASRGLSLLKMKSHHSHVHDNHQHSGIDPHIWLDFENDQKIVDNISDVLSNIDPLHSSHYVKNASLYKDKLKNLDQKFTVSFNDCTHKTFILGGHAAFGYLARKYNLRQISLYGLSPDSRPTPKQLIEVIQLAKKYEINVIFFELYMNDELARTIAEEVGARVLVLNPGANLTKKQLDSGITFFDIMEENLENLKDGLICR